MSATITDLAAAVTPVASDGSTKVHATLAHDPIGTTVRTLCGRTMRVTSEWPRGTFGRHARNTRANYLGGGCVRCATAAQPEVPTQRHPAPRTPHEGEHHA